MTFHDIICGGFALIARIATSPSAVTLTYCNNQEKAPLGACWMKYKAIVFSLLPHHLPVSYSILEVPCKIPRWQ